MNIKINEEQEKKEKFSLPSRIQNEVDEKWFYLYNWISTNDVKSSIEKDFLSIISKIWNILAIFAVLIWLIFFSNLYLLFIVFFSFIWIISILILIFLSIPSFKKSFILSKNAFVVLTNSHISINWKIVSFNNVSSLANDMDKIANEFDEYLFQDSNLSKTKSDLIKEIRKKIFEWYETISKLLKNNKDSRALFIWYLMYSLYAFIMFIIYFAWTVFLWLFTLVLNFINKFILKIKWHEVISINYLFDKIDSNSVILNNEKNNLIKNLLKAKNNEWQDALLLNINSWIDKITKESEIAVKNSLNLGKKLQNSKYNDIFDFSVYNSWIKKQIYDPIDEVEKLLTKNLEVIVETMKDIKNQINITEEKSFKDALSLQEKRLEIRVEEIEKFIALIKSYKEKLII